MADTEPITVNLDPPQVGTPEGIDLSDATVEDFARKANAVPLTAPRKTKPVGKRVTVEQELERVREELNRNISFVGLLLCARDPYGGQLLLLNKDSVIDKWIDVCRINPTIRRALLAAMDMGVYATAITSTIALAIAYLAHAGMLPNSDLVLSAVSGAGVNLPTDEQVEMTEAMFGMFQGDNATPQRDASGRFVRRNGNS